MTLINFVRENDLPDKNEIERKINELGYNFKFITDFNKLNEFNSIDSIECKLNGNKTFIEIYLNSSLEILESYPSAKQYIDNENLGISFSFGSDETVFNCVTLISIALIDLSQSIVLFADDEIVYNREMLFKEIQYSSNNEKDNYDFLSDDVFKEAYEENLKFDREKKIKEKIERNKKLKSSLILGVIFLIVLILLIVKIIS